MAKTESTAAVVKPPENDNDKVPDFKRRFAELAAMEIPSQAEKAPARAASKPSNNVLRLLPVWPEATRAAPNGVLRSALFGALPKGPRRYMRGERVAALEGIEIFYTGEQLDQDDLDVWLAVLHLCRIQALGESCSFTAYELLRLLGKGNTGGKRGNRTLLDLRLTRLKATAVRVELANRYSYEGSLLAGIYRDKETKHYVAMLDPEMRALFEPDQYTQVEWAIRHALDGKPLAQWLHGYYSSHAAPYPVKISTLRELCGSDGACQWKFKQTLVRALNAVAEACRAHEPPQHFAFEFERDLVCVERAPTKTQRRHLEKKARKQPR